MCYSSIWLSMNVLIINSKTICVEASEEKMNKQMESFGMDVVPVPLEMCMRLRKFALFNN